MFLRNTLLGAYVTEHVQLLLVVSTHNYLLSAYVVEMRGVFQHPASGPRSDLGEVGAPVEKVCCKRVGGGLQNPTLISESISAGDDKDEVFSGRGKRDY
jgi:hypothetical protein